MIPEKQSNHKDSREIQDEKKDEFVIFLVSLWNIS